MNNSNQFLKNLVVNCLNFCVNIAVGLLLTPFLVKNFGIGLFGLFQIAVSISMYASILSTSLNQANNRFVAVSLADNFQKTAKILDTIFTLYIIGYSLILPLIMLASFYLDAILNIQKNSVESASLMFIFIAVSQLFIMQTTCLNSIAYAKNRLDIIQLINITRNLLKLLLVFLLVSYYSSSLSSVGLAFFSSSLVSIILAFKVFRMFLPSYSYNLKGYDLDVAKKIFKLSGWTIVSVLGALLFQQTDVIILNTFLGAVESGKYAVIKQWSMLLISISTVLSVVVSPLILNKYAYNNIVGLKKIFYLSIKFQGILSATATGIVIAYSDIILILWLGPEYKTLSTFLIVMIVHLGLTQATRQLATINTAYNTMRWHGIITILIGFLHCLISCLLLSYSSLGLLGVIISNVVFSLLLHTVCLPWYVSKKMQEPLWKIYQNLLPSLLVQIVTVLAGFVLRKLFLPTGFLFLTITLFLNVFLVLIFTYNLLLTSEEKEFLFAYLKKWKN